MTDINASDMTREQHIEQGLKLLTASNAPDVHRVLLAAQAQAHLLAAQLMPTTQPAGKPGETLTLFMVAKRDYDGDLWISFDGERWQMVDPSKDPAPPSAYGPYTDITIVPLTS